MQRYSNRGFTLLEVLVAVLIFSLGLMGLAGLLVVSVKTNHAAYMRTQATFVAQSMADRMRANPLGLWNSSYNIALAAATTATVPTLCKAGTCDYSDIATRDLVVFQDQLMTFLPAPKTMISCTTAQAPSAEQMLMLPPYAGTCEMLIQWGDVSNIESKSVASEDVTFDWVFQP